jgi:host factor-I protein
MSKVNMNLQDSFLNQVRKEATELKMVLVDGTTLTGVVRGFDNFTVILSSRGAQHLIYKHAISQLIWRRTPGHKEHTPEDTPARKRAGFNQLDLSEVKIESGSG